MSVRKLEPFYSNEQRFEMGLPVRECKMGYRMAGNEICGAAPIRVKRKPFHAYLIHYYIPNSAVLESIQIYRSIETDTATSHDSWKMKAGVAGD